MRRIFINNIWCLLSTPWAPILAEQAEPQAGDRVLDIAWGTGVVARVAAQQVGVTGQVTGLDINPGMLKVARSLGQVAGATVDWHEGDACQSTFSDEGFDAVFNQLGPLYFPDRTRALREIRRLLVPNGRTGLLVWRAIVHSPGFAAIAEAMDTHISAAAGDTMGTPFMFGDSREELRSFANEAGFSHIRIHSDVRMVHFASPEALVQYQVAGSPLAGHVAETDDTVRDAVVTYVATAMQDY